MAVIMIMCVAAVFGQQAKQQSDCKNFKVPAFNPSRYFYDPDRILEIEKAAHLETTLERAPINTRVLFCKDAPSRDAKDRSTPEHYGLDYPVGNIGELFSKPARLGEYRSKDEKPSLVLVVTIKHGDPRLRWWISSNDTNPDKQQRINNAGYEAFSAYIRTKTPMLKDTDGRTLYEATLKSLWEVVWPTLKQP